MSSYFVVSLSFSCFSFDARGVLLSLIVALPGDVSLIVPVHITNRQQERINIEFYKCFVTNVYGEISLDNIRVNQTNNNNNDDNNDNDNSVVKDEQTIKRMEMGIEKK